jgi:CRISPR-associated protein Cpf1
MYFRELMSCDEGSCFALGAGTVFYRKASLKKEKPTHEAESPIKCKRSDKESKFPYPLYKDRRFMENQFQLHLSVTANCKPEEITNDNKKVVTDKVRAALRDTENPIQDENLRIIGIDRGERNLLYVCEINGKGEIVKQFSLNIVADDEKPEIKTDYQGLLTKREQERNENRKSWQPLENIANLKKGYLSQAVHQICKLAVDENAFIAMEDLDSNFRQKRVHVEKNVYQQFEKALIEKLNFLVFKDKEPDEPGGLRNAYQLTDQFTSFQDLPKQSGILFYVSPWYTSAIDPWTGFISRFHIEYYNLEKSKEFLDQFTDIHYDREKDAFAFTFDYKNFDKYLNKFQDWEKRTGWTVYSCGQRIKKEKKKEGKGYEYQEVYPTELFKTAFENDKVNIKYDDGHDLRDDITQINDSQFYKDILTALKLTFQMRNSNPETGKDYILSPVFDKKHFDEKHSGFFDSRDFFDQYDKEKKYAEMPIDADANGAYHIAQKCLLAIQRIKDSEKPNLYISAEEWLNARQGRNGQSTDNQTGGEEKSKNQS